MDALTIVNDYGAGVGVRPASLEPIGLRGKIPPKRRFSYWIGLRRRLRGALLGGIDRKATGEERLHRIDSHGGGRSI